MNRIAATLVALTAAVTMAPAPASAVDNGPLAVTTSSLSTSTSTSCATVPITWYLTSAPSDVDTWSVDGDIVDLGGASRGWIFHYEKLPVTQAGDTYTICGLVEGANTFTVAADVDAWTPSYTMYSTRFTGTLTITRTTPPPPPPPVFNTRMIVAGSPSWTERPDFARLLARIEFRGYACKTGRRELILAGRRGAGDWKVIGKTKVDSAHPTTVTAKVGYSFRKVRFETTATPGCTADTTLPLRVPRKV